MIRVERDQTARVVLPRGFLEDSRLSLRARGLLASLLACEAVDDLDPMSLERSADRRGDAAAALQELERAGYYVPSSAGGAQLEAPSGTVYEASRRPTLSSPASARASGARPEKVDRASDHDAIVERLMACLNELRARSWTWARYTPLTSRHAMHVEHIKGRLKEGYTEADLVLILEYRAAVDAGDENSKKYYDPGTLFNTRNFERNLGLARDWDARGRLQGADPLALQRADGHDPEIYERRVRGGGA